MRTITAPSDSRLPGGGGYSVGNLVNLVPGKLGQNSNNIADAANFGAQSQKYDGILINFSARASKGLTIQGGINSGTTATDNCAIAATVPERAGIPGTNFQNTFCHNEPGYIKGERGRLHTSSRESTSSIAGQFEATRVPCLRQTGTRRRRRWCSRCSAAR
jgi:hypothetical protein